MHTHRFGRKLKLPSTIAIKHQIRQLMLEDLISELEVLRRAEKVVGPVALMRSTEIDMSSTKGDFASSRMSEWSSAAHRNDQGHR
jgi:hypothetical protein